jgi:hypothetical protein
MENTNIIQNEKPIVLTTTKGHEMYHEGVEMTKTEIIKHFLREAEKTEEKIAKLNQEIEYLQNTEENQIAKQYEEALIESRESESKWMNKYFVMFDQIRTLVVCEENK